MNDMFVRRRGQVSGPFPFDEIKAMIARGELVPLHELSSDGIEWIRAGKIWDEFVPKPKSMIEMAERRPIQLKPAVQPVDIHKTSDHQTHEHKSLEQTSRDRKSSDHKPKPEHREAPPPAAPRKLTPLTDHSASASQPPTADEPLLLSAKHEMLDALTEVDGDDFIERDRQVRPEPLMGAAALRGLAVLVGCSAAAWMALSIVCIVLDLRTLDAFMPPTLDRLEEIYASGIFAVSDFIRVLIFVFKLFFFVLFLVWIYFSARFLFQKSHGRMRFTPGWSAGWFLVPIANLVKPYKVVLELERRSEQYLRFDDPRIIRDPVVKVWWTCWILEKVAVWFLASNRNVLEQLVHLNESATPDRLERLKRLPKLVADFHTNEIACLCVAFVSGAATLVLLYRLEKVRPKWETRSRRRSTMQ